MLVRKNLAPHLKGSSMFWVELIPMVEQIWAATMHDARTFLSTTVEGEGFCATAEEVHATRTKEEGMVQELLNGWQKGAQGTYRRLRMTKSSVWDVKMLIA
jgi:hypothetical protein